MPDSKSQRSAGTRKATATRKRRAPASDESESRSAVDRTTELSEDVLKSIESGQRTAIEAVRKFVDTVDQNLPLHGESHSRGQEIIDAAMEMADRLVQTQFDFLRKVVDTAGKSLGGSGERK